MSRALAVAHMIEFLGAELQSCAEIKKKQAKESQDEGEK